MSKQLSVSAIKHGTVIDHIPPGKAFALISLLKLAQLKKQITVGMYLKSGKSKSKDIIKIEGTELSNEMIEGIAILAPDATINFIKDFEVFEKVTAKLPSTISGILPCPNRKCITHSEPVKSLFNIEAFGKNLRLSCHFCEKIFKREEMSYD